MGRRAFTLIELLVVSRLLTSMKNPG